MEKYIAIVILLAPGYIAKSIAFLLGASQSKRGEIESVMVYFSYSLFALLATLFGAFCFKLVGVCDSWNTIEIKFHSIWYSFLFFTLSIFCSAVVGAVWQLFLEKNIVKLFNCINSKLRNGNIVFLNGSLFDRLFVDDLKKHFLIVEKDGRTIAVGFLWNWSAPDAERVEFHVVERPIYKEWMAYAQTEDGKDHPLNRTMGVYCDVTSGMVIRELEYPFEWLTESPGKPPIKI